jgi:DNA polymerase-3 subunit delta
MPKRASSTPDAVLKAEAPDAVYLLYGDDDFLKHEAVQAFVERFSDAATRAFNVDVLQGNDVAPGALATALDCVPMLAARRVVVIRDFPALQKDARSVLDARLEFPPADVTIILVAPAGWKPDPALTARVTNVQVIPPEGRDAEDWIASRAGMLGATIERDAAELLLRATAGDLGQADGELRKLRDFATNGRITSDAVAAIVGVTSGATADDFLDLVCERNGPGAAALVANVLAQPKSSAVSLVLALTAHFLLLGHVVARRSRHAPSRQLAGELYALMGEARSVAVGRPWGAAVNAVIHHSDAWDSWSVDRALQLLRDADNALKETNLSGEARMLETLVLRLCAPSPRSRAA